MPLLPQTDYKTKRQLSDKEYFDWGRELNTYTFNNCDHDDDSNYKKICKTCAIDCLVHVAARPLDERQPDSAPAAQKTRLPYFCQKCGVEQYAAANFCGNCGSRSVVKWEEFVQEIKRTKQESPPPAGDEQIARGLFQWLKQHKIIDDSWIVHVENKIIQHIAEVVSSTRKSGIEGYRRKVLEAIYRFKGGFTIDPVSGKLVNDPDGPWTVAADVANLVESLPVEDNEK